MSLTEAGRLLECVSKLQDAEVLFVAADDLDAYRKSFWREACRHGCRRIPGRGDIPAGFHPVDIVVEFDARDFRGVGHVDIERRQLRRRQHEIFVLLEESLKA